MVVRKETDDDPARQVNATAPAAHAEQLNGITDPVGASLADLSASFSASCVLEDRGGRVISHAAGVSVPACLVEAVVSRCVAPMLRARGSANTLGVVPGGPVLITSLAGWDGAVTILPVAGLGRLWVLHTAELSLTDCASAGKALSEVLERIGGRATDEVLWDALHGIGSRPVSDGTVVVAVVAVSAHVTAIDLHAALRQTLRVRADVTAAAGLAYVVLPGFSGPALDQLLQQAGSRLGVELAGVVAPTVRGLAAGREEAERALAARPVAGRCLNLSDCRPYTTFPALLKALDATPVLGGDPLADLDEVLVITLRAWLDHLGDVTGAALSLQVHPNTFRYRLNRAKELVSVDLLDPVARIDLHLRLHRLAQAAKGSS